MPVRKKRIRTGQISKTRKLKFPLVLRIHSIFDTYRERINMLTHNDMTVNNLICDLRNETVSLMNEIYQKLYVSLRHGIHIEPERDKNSFALIGPCENAPCAVCGETRVTNKCHIIPREAGGTDAESNLIFLCANHHHLFDHARLKEQEFGKIELAGKASDSVAYYDKIHRIRHKMYWRYSLHMSEGCKCGSLDFKYDVIANGERVEPALVCSSCGTRYYIGIHHPLVMTLSQVAYNKDEGLSEIERNRLLEEAKTVVRERLRSAVPDSDILKG